MKNKVLLSLLFLTTVISNVFSQTLKFNPDSTFKIVQFTDIHYIYNDKRADIALERIKEVLSAEHPDLVIMTGDVIYGKPAEESLRTVLNTISEFKIPFAVTFGNHDDEQGLTRNELLNIISSYKYNLSITEKDIKGNSNYILPVKSVDGLQTSALIYCFDSNSYSSLEGIKGYDYIHHDQIQWYIEKSKYYIQNNNGKPVHSLAFFHIPLPEFHEAVSDENSIMIGTRMEKACSPVLNSGLFSAMREMGDVKGVFVGHDHDNDYAVNWKGILLAYGRYTGGNTVYNHLPNGARIIELKQGSDSFKTWIRLKDNKIINEITFSNNIGTKK